MLKFLLWLCFAAAPADGALLFQSCFSQMLFHGPVVGDSAHAIRTGANAPQAKL